MSTAIQPSPSLTANEEDISNRSSPYYENDDFVTSQENAFSKGKGRELRSETSTPDAFSERLEDTGYPPTNDEAEETRKIEENLRRWEIAERQKRRAARGSSQSSNTPSLMSDVTKRASLLWSNRKTKNVPPGGIGTHAALQSSENIDTVPLNHISPIPSPTRSSSLDSNATTTYTNNPFTHPEDSSSSISTSHTDDTITLAERPSNNTTITTSRSQTRSHPPPQPLNLPPPRTPPPTVYAESPTTDDVTDPSKPEPEVRWWHDWLCGCSEGKDRGGDHQAGRTNPFE